MKLTNTSTHIKVPLSCLRVTNNVRQNFNEEEIVELARSIKENGLVNAITVKPPVEEDGVKIYEVIAGGRRIRAHQWLCEHGDDFSMIDCKISTGDMWTIQMVENIQRTDLSPRDKEDAVLEALDSGLTQKQIANKLSKPIQWISDIVAGAKVRKIADDNGIATDSIGTKTLSQLRSIPEAELPEKLRQLTEEGGTYRQATRIAQEQKNESVSTSVSNEKETNSNIDAFDMEEHSTTAANNNIELEEDEEDYVAPTTSAPDPVIEKKLVEQKPPASFREISNDIQMEAAVLSLPGLIKKMSPSTKICVKTSAKIEKITAIQYKPDSDELIFIAKAEAPRL